MQGEIGKVAPGQMVDTQVLNYQGIRTDLIKGSQSFDELPALSFLYQGIESDVELAAALAADLDQRRYFGQAEVGCVGPGAKGFETHVNGVGAIIQGSKKCFNAA